MLGVAAALVLLLGCLNVATLSLVRASVRLAIGCGAFALGASRMRIIRDLLVEGAILATIGSVGCSVARVGIVRGVRQWAAFSLPRARELESTAPCCSSRLRIGARLVIASLVCQRGVASTLVGGEQLQGGQRGASATAVTREFVRRWSRCNSALPCSC